MGNADNTLSVLLNTTPAGLPAGTLAATFTASLAGATFAGAKAGTATVTVTAPASSAVNGPVTVSLFASPDLSLFDATQVSAARTQDLSLKAGASKTLRVPVSLFGSTPAGTYHLIAAVQAPDGTTTAVAGPSVTIVKRAATIAASDLSAMPATVDPGAKVTLALTLQNTGNIPAAGTASLAIFLSTSASGAGVTPAATVPLRVKLPAGQSKPYRVRFAIPRATAAGSYYLVASLAAGTLRDTSAVGGVAVSAMPIMVS